MINQLYPKPTRPAMADNPRPAARSQAPPAKPPAASIPAAGDGPKPEPGQVPERYACEIEIEGSINGIRMKVTKRNADVRKLASAVEYLKSQGFRQEAPPLRFELTPDGSPICPKHNVPMQRREKQGDVWHSHKLVAGDGSEHFCRGYRGPDSSGFDVEEGGRR